MKVWKKPPAEIIFLYCLRDVTCVHVPIRYSLIAVYTEIVLHWYSYPQVYISYIYCERGRFINMLKSKRLTTSDAIFFSIRSIWKIKKERISKMYVIKNAPWTYFSYLKFRYEKRTIIFSTQLFHYKSRYLKFIIRTSLWPGHNYHIVLIHNWIAYMYLTYMLIANRIPIKKLGEVHM